MISYKQNNTCRICNSDNLTKYLDLGMMPLPNNLKSTSLTAYKMERFPLQVLLCNDCGLSQLSVVIDPDILFKYYTYRSGINKGYINHCHKMAEDLSLRFGFNDKTFHIDIAGNDGTLLMEFRKVLHNMDTLWNVDPAENLKEICQENRIFTISDYWSTKIVNILFKDLADLITATNVFAHVDDIKEFINACKLALKPDGILVIENPYLIDFIENMEFDTIYFEHLSYWSLLPMIKFCSDNGMKVIYAEKQEIHGGSMRYIITHENSKYTVSPAIKNLCKEEKRRGFNNINIYNEWADKIKIFISELKNNLLNLKKEGNTIIAFAASAKGNTLLNSAKIDSSVIDCIIDETPEKIGKYYPGNAIPIVGIENIMKLSPDYIIILSWNFKDEIIEKVKSLGYTKNFIIPIPRWQII